jgi:predicted RNA-binding Zn-ribbon protein involved in translation (DUF1610 family)
VKRRCPGMDPAYFKLEDISSQKCTECGGDIEFWKDDVFLICPACGVRNTNARVQNTCLAWCKEATKCVGNKDIDEWLRLQKSKGKSENPE